ncbi:MAG: hypothetical protein WAX89_05650 [Alphaproteobacteria bacterium]
MTKRVEIFDEQTGVTGTSLAMLVKPEATVTAMASGTGSATLQVTIDPHNTIIAGSATWVNAANGAQIASFAETGFGAITGMRLVATSGTWALKVRQVVGK